MSHPKPETALRRFWDRVMIGDGCWEWTGHRDSHGYGRVDRFGYDGRRYIIGAHRLAWIMFFGPVPEGLDVLHTCDNPGCVRPGHLHLGTHAENMREAAERGLMLAGPRSPLAKLSTADVLAIRASAERGCDLARLYGVTGSHISDIRHRNRRVSATEERDRTNANDEGSTVQAEPRSDRGEAREGR